MIKKLFLIILAVFLLVPSFSYAICEGNIVPCGQDINANGVIDPNEMCTFCHLFELTNNIIVYLMTCLAPIISGIMLILGGFYLMIAGVDPGKMEQGKKVITAAIIGLIVMFVAWILLNTFFSSLSMAKWTGLGTWWEFQCN